MILYIENGQLGNKLFQYVGLKKFFPQEKIIFLGRDNTQELFDNIDLKFISMKKIPLLFFYYLKYLILFLIRIRFLSVITENASLKNYKIKIKKGLFWRILVSHNNFFQHNEIIDEIKNFPILKKKFVKKGIIWLKNKKVDNKKKIVFVHIRRGDYLSWPSKKFPASLSIDWYKKKMRIMKNKLQNPIFIIISDDYQYVLEQFKETDSILISNNNREIDLSIMSLCNAGILSSSSYAWWGAFFAKTRNENNSYFIAPNYWLGHRKKKWLPDNFYTKWITYFE